MPAAKPLPPGLLRPTVKPDVRMMICTAGHVDHGKTSLVKLMTGCNTDRLKVEQERGMSIELGFAPCVLGGNLCIGIVDVPGHEKFIRNMVAGVSGIGMTVLVIAADDGIMPQTIEHFQIMDLLGVRNGMIALTKIDLVSAERVREATEEIREFFRGTFLDGAPICPVSSETFEGYFEFYETLVQRATAVLQSQGTGVFRMPIERVFTRPGFGTIVTGIPVAGELRVGTEVELVPGGHRSRVRGIQRFLRDADEGAAGQCLAVNIPDTGKSEPARGDVLAAAGFLRASTVFHVRLRSVPGLAKPLHNAEEVKFHTGTSEMDGKLFLLEDEEVGGSREALASVVLHAPVAAAAHDRFILRRPSPASTVAGGEILMTTGDRRGTKRTVAPQVRAYADALGTVDPRSQEGLQIRATHLLSTTFAHGATAREIARELLIPLAEAGALLRTEGVELEQDFFVLADAREKSVVAIGNWLKDQFASGRVSVPFPEARTKFDYPAPLWAWCMKDLQARKLAETRESRFIPCSAAESLSSPDRRLAEEILRIYETAGFQSPREEEVAEKLRLLPKQVGRLVEMLCNERRLVRLNSAVTLSYATCKQAQDLVVKVIQEKGTLNSSDMKYHINSSRKYALAILDWLDTRRVTLRIGNDRKLAKGYEQNLLR